MQSKLPTSLKLEFLLNLNIMQCLLMNYPGTMLITNDVSIEVLGMGQRRIKEAKHLFQQNKDPPVKCREFNSDANCGASTFSFRGAWRGPGPALKCCKC